MTMQVNKNQFFVKKDKNNNIEKHVFSDGSWIDYNKGVRINSGRNNTLRNWFKEQKVAVKGLLKWKNVPEEVVLKISWSIQKAFGISRAEFIGEKDYYTPDESKKWINSRPTLKLPASIPELSVEKYKKICKRLLYTVDRKRLFKVEFSL